MIIIYKKDLLNLSCLLLFLKKFFETREKSTLFFAESKHEAGMESNRLVL